jgi:hypothetical protein
MQHALATFATIAVCGLSTSVNAQSAEGEVTITQTQEQALRDYMQSRYRRVKKTVISDRDTAREYMSQQFENRYERRFTPDKSLPKFQQCDDCEEFGVAIDRIRTASEPVPEGVTPRFFSMVEWHTLPLNDTAGSSRAMATKLIWTDVSNSPEHDKAIEILNDAPLVHRRHITNSDMNTPADPTTPAPELKR